MKNVYSILINDKKWYILPVKDKPFVRGQQSIANEVLEDEKRKYNGSYELKYQKQKWSLSIKDFGKELKAIIKNMDARYAGFYNYKNELFLNIRFCKFRHSISEDSKKYQEMSEEERDEEKQKKTYNDKRCGGGKGLYKFLTHELHHAFQEYLVRNKVKILEQTDNDPTLKKYIDQLNAYIFGNTINIDSMGFKSSGNLCIKPYTPFSKDNTILAELSQIFYYLNVSEYEAFKIGEEKFGDLITEDFATKIPYSTMNAMVEFMDRYDYYSDNIEDVVDIVSYCILKVYNKEEPENKLEASIMYDICCIAYLQEMGISNDERKNREQECADLLQSGEKEKIIQQYDDFKQAYNNKKIYNRSDFYMFLSQENPLINLTVEEQKNNPELVLFLASKKVDKNVDYHLYADNALKEYCQNRKHFLYNDLDYRDGAKTIFGENFWKDIGVEQDDTVQEQTEHRETINHYISHTLNINQDEEEIDI